MMKASALSMSCSVLSQSVNIQTPIMGGGFASMGRETVWHSAS